MEHSPHSLRKYLPVILLLLLAIPMFFLNIQEGHSAGGDDYAQYIKESQNIASGRPYYLSNYVFNRYNNCYSPPQYPPGFPLLLAPVVKFYGIAIKPMCYFNTVIAVGLLICFFIYFRKNMEEVAAFCLSIVIAYSGYMISQKQAVLSDASSLLFVMLYLIARNAATFSWQRIVLLAVFAAMAILIRTQSILLLFAELIWLFIIVIKDWVRRRQIPVKLLYKSPSLYIVVGCFAIILVLNKTIFYCPDTAAGFYVDFLKITFQKGLITVIRDNINFFVEALSSFFYYETNNNIRTALVSAMQHAGVTFSILGFVIVASRQLRFDDIFFVLVCGLMLYYPIHDARYFMPAIAIVFYYCYSAFKQIIPAITSVKSRYLGVASTIIFLFSGLGYLKTTLSAQPGYVPAQKDWQAFNYIKQHVKDNELIICARPRLLTLYTDRRCIIHAWQYPMEINKKIFDSMQAKYLLQMDGIVNSYYKTYLNEYQHPIDSLTISEGYTLYTLR